DNVDASVTVVTTGTVDTNTVGTYTLHYNATDAAGNHATEVTRTVNVVNNTIPVITLLGSSDVTVSVGSTYTDAGATAVDQFGTDITPNIVTTGLPIDTSASGDF